MSGICGRMRWYSASFAFLLVFWTCSANASDAVVNSEAKLELGGWKIVKVLGYSDIADMSERDARKLIGRRVRLEKGKFVFDGEVCEKPSYARTRVDSVKTLREDWHASSAGIGLPDIAVSYDVGCTTVFAKGNNIVVPWGGYFFEAVSEKSRKRSARD